MNIFVAASLGDTVTDAVSEVASALRYPVLILALLALALVTYELGRLGAEALQRKQRSKEPFDQLSRRAQQVAWSGDSAGAQAILNEYAYNGQLKQAAVATMFAQNPVDAQRSLVDYDLYVSKRLDRVRLLVRSGPALGLMGTLIPLAPALAALGEGDAKVLADELQTAFAITVVGVAIGLIAFGVALVRERYYTKDLADLEYLREIRGDAVSAGGAIVLARSASTQGSDVTDSTTSIPSGTAAPAQAPPATDAATVVAAPPVQAAALAEAAPVALPPAAVQPQPPAAPSGGKKKFGIKKKDKGSAAEAAPPAPIAFPPPPPPPAASVVAPAIPETPTGKSPTLPDAPQVAEPFTDAEPFADPASGEDKPATDDDGVA